MPGTVLFVASNPTAIKFDFAGELNTISEALKSRAGSPTILARWSVSSAALKSAVQSRRPEIVHLRSPGVDPITNALVMSDAQGRPEYAAPATIAAAFEAPKSRSPKLVVLNTCHSRVHAEAIASQAGCVIAMDGTYSQRAGPRQLARLRECLVTLGIDNVKFLANLIGDLF